MVAGWHITCKYTQPDLQMKNYIKHQNEIYRLKRFCEKSLRMLYFKKIAKTKNGRYTYVFINGKRVNFDSIIGLVPQANVEQIKFIKP